VVALHISAHLLAANTMALELAGISAATPHPEGGRIRRRENGEPTGVLEETAMTPVFMRLPQPSIELASEQLLTALEHYASFGATTAQEALLFQPAFLQAAKALEDTGGCRWTSSPTDVPSRGPDDGCGRERRAVPSGRYEADDGRLHPGVHGVPEPPVPRAA
jgi:predicted amidohydrolase YtcJ